MEYYHLAMPFVALPLGGLAGYAAARIRSAPFALAFCVALVLGAALVGVWLAQQARAAEGADGLPLALGFYFGWSPAALGLGTGLLIGVLRRRR